MSLAEQILALSNPKPASFHPDEEFLRDETAAKVCDFAYEDVPTRSSSATNRPGGGRVKIKRSAGLEGDPRYAGKVVSREELEADSGEGELEVGGAQLCQP